RTARTLGGELVEAPMARLESCFDVPERCSVARDGLFAVAQCSACRVTAPEVRVERRAQRADALAQLFELGRALGGLVGLRASERAPASERRSRQLWERRLRAATATASHPQSATTPSPSSRAVAASRAARAGSARYPTARRRHPCGPGARRSRRTAPDSSCGPYGPGPSRHRGAARCCRGQP